MTAETRQPIRIACEGADTLSLDRLTPLQRDLKRLSPANAARLRKEILELGFSEPISVWQSNGTTYILNGHQRVTVLKAMQAEGYTIPSLPVSRVDATDLEQARRKILALTSQYGEMTPDGLSDFLAETQLTLPEVEASFRFPEIDMSALMSEASIVEDAVPEPPADPITHPGEVVDLGRHRVMCGDVRTHKLAGVNAIVTDPPYGIGFTYASSDDSRKAWFELMDATVPHFIDVADVVVMPCSGIDRLGWWYTRHPPDWIIAWYKGSPGHRAHVGFNDWEPHLVWGKPPSQIHDYFQTRCGFEIEGHPCPKPVAWAAWLCERFCPAGGTMADPFLGSGTTLIAAEQLGRTCYGMEIEPRYVDVCVRRFYNLVGWDQAPAEHRERWEPA